MVFNSLAAPLGLGGFAAARALSTGFNETPARASRPFDRDRDGFVMGEGAGILVIEELEHALRRGAQPIAEIVGYGTTADAYHITSGLEDGDGARRAMEGALRQAGLNPGDIQHLNAHSTSTPIGDVSELEAIKADVSLIHPSSETAIGQDEELQEFTGNVVAREGLEPPTPGL